MRKQCTYLLVRRPWYRSGSETRSCPQWFSIFIEKSMSIIEDKCNFDAKIYVRIIYFLICIRQVNWRPTIWYFCILGVSIIFWFDTIWFDLDLIWFNLIQFNLIICTSLCCDAIIYLNSSSFVEMLWLSEKPKRKRKRKKIVIFLNLERTNASVLSPYHYGQFWNFWSGNMGVQTSEIFTSQFSSF